MEKIESLLKKELGVEPEAFVYALHEDSNEAFGNPIAGNREYLVLYH